MRTGIKSKATAVVLGVVAGVLFSGSALANPVAGAVLNLEAGNNSRYATPVTEWTNLSDPATYLSKEPVGNPGDLVRGVDPDLTAYYSASPVVGATGGSLGRVDGSNGGSGRVAEPSLFLESASVEIWTRRQGSQLGGGEAQVFGLRSVGHVQRLTGHLVGEQWDTWEFNIRGSGGSALNHTSTVAIPADGSFHQYVITWDDVGKDLSVYVDGAGTPAWSVNDPTQDFLITDDMWMNSVFKEFAIEGEGRRYNGDISVFRVYDRVLNAGEIEQNYLNGPSLIPEPGTLALLGLGGLLAVLRRRR